MLDHIETTLLNLGYESIVIIGNMDLAQAYPGRVVLVTPSNGYENVSYDKQRMNLTKFRVF